MLDERLQKEKGAFRNRQSRQAFNERGRQAMEKSEQICALLKEKCGLFLQYEQETDALLACTLEEMQAHMKEREKLAGQIDGVDRQISEACGGSQEVMDAVYNRCDRGGLPEALAKIYDSAQPVFQIINRIRQAEPLAEMRMQREKDALEVKIKQSNRSSAAQASRYFSGARGSESAARSAHFRKV